MVLIKPDPIPEQTKYGIFIPEDARPKPKQGTVVKVGETVDTVKEDDVVVFQSHFADEMPIDGEIFLVIKESNILYVV